DELNVEHQHFGESLRERLAIHAINTLSEQNVIKVVPEHVEIRTLYNPDQPGIPQGYIHLWVDMFNLKHGTPPPPICIKKIQPKEYELRVCIYGTVDMHLDETSITGEKMSDVYIKGWISEQDETQKTDVHYRCLDGQASFNWRFKFPFEYISSTSSIVIKKKEHFWNLNSAERQVEPTFIIQAWDNDVISRDDYLGSLEMHLNNLPPPAKSAKVCNIKQLNKKRVSLFKNKRLRGFWPIFDKDDNNNKICRGKIEMEMEIVDKNEIIQKPCGNARDEPNQYPKLEPPKIMKIQGNIVLPGKELDLKETLVKIGPGIEFKDQKYISTLCGRYYNNEGIHWIDSNKKKYTPTVGEFVIGIIVSVKSESYIVDINANKIALLSKLDFEGATKKTRPMLKRGDLVYAVIILAADHVDPEISCIHESGRHYGLDQLSNTGYLMRTSLFFCREILHKRSKILEDIGSICQFEASIGMNGRIWIQSNSEEESYCIMQFLKSLNRSINETKNSGFLANLSKIDIRNLHRQLEKVCVK
ncbi:Ribosomal RNA-processing protein 40, partial [Intoshia linei]